MNLRDLREFLFRLAAGLGLGVSLALLWEYTQAAGPALCVPGGGCDVVRESAYASFAGIPTPVFGVLFFGAALVLAALPGQRARNLLALWAAGGAGISVVLLALQAAVIGAFCVACVTADAAALAMLPLALAGRRDTSYPRPRIRLATAAAAMLAMIPFVYGVAQTGRAAPATAAPQEALVEELPAPVAERQVEGKVTIVEFLDFTCPFCQRFHHALKQVLPEFSDDVAIARVYIPNPRNDTAQLAALSAICAEARGEGDALTEALMDSPNLGPQSILAAWLNLGFSQEDLAECMTADATMTRLEAQFEAAQAIGLEGLPTVFIGRERFGGAMPPDEIRAAIERAIERGDHAL